MPKLNQKDLSNNPCAKFIEAQLPGELAYIAIQAQFAELPFSKHQIARTLQAMNKAGLIRFVRGEWVKVRQAPRTEIQSGVVGLQLLGSLETEVVDGVFCPVEAMVNEGAPAHA